MESTDIEQAEMTELYNDNEEIIESRKIDELPDLPHLTILIIIMKSYMKYTIKTHKIDLSKLLCYDKSY